jgi:hypothetical protein
MIRCKNLHSKWQGFLVHGNCPSHEPVFPPARFYYNVLIHSHLTYVVSEFVPLEEVQGPSYYVHEQEEKKKKKN